MRRWRYSVMMGAALILLGLTLGGCDTDLCFFGCNNDSDAEAQEPLSNQPQNIFIPRGTFTTEYSGEVNGPISQRAIGITAARNKRNLEDLFLSFSFFPPKASTPEAEVGRATLSILIPRRDSEDVEDMQGEDIDIVDIQPSNTEPSATYLEEGDNPFTANSVVGIINFQFVESNQISGTFEFTFTSGGRNRLFTEGSFAAFVDLNPVEEGFQFPNSQRQ